MADHPDSLVTVRAFVAASALSFALGACSTVDSAPGWSNAAGVPAARTSQRAANTLTVLHSFQSGGTDGLNPRGGVILDGAGNIFGTTVWGGTNDWGTIYELKPASGSYTESIVYNYDGSTGAGPWAAPLEDQNANLYVTNFFSGVFELSPTGSGYEVVGIGQMISSKGDYPTAGVLAIGPTIYTAAVYGALYGQGSIVAMDASNITNVTDVWDFKGPPSDGARPLDTLVADAGGSIYGATNVGGVENLGAVFRFIPKSGKERLLWSFHGKKDGANPKDPLVIDTSGNIYGTTFYGGKDNLGVIFKLSPKGGGYTLNVLHTFAGPPADGQFPMSGLTLVGDVLYGTTFTGGSGNDGTIFSLSTAGSDYTLLHDFQGSDGIGPDGSLFAQSGTLYGATLLGGTSGGAGQQATGVVFSFTP